MEKCSCKITENNRTKYLTIKNKKTAPKKGTVSLKKNHCRDYLSRSTDFTSLSSFLIYMFAITRQNIESKTKTGSIPFSGN